MEIPPTEKCETTPATINKDLRHIQAALKKAKRWKDLAELPEIEFVEESQYLKNFITEPLFVDIYKACDVATQPSEELPYAPSEWWQGLLTFAFCTG